MTIAHKTKKLGDVAEFVRGITFKPTDVTSLEASGSIACFRTKNVQTDLDLTDVWGIPREFVKRKDKILRVGDILVSTANSWNLVGKCCWVPDLPWQATLGGFISALRPTSQEIYPRYLYRWFSSESVQQEVRSCANQTTNISNLSLNRCLAIDVPVPHMDDQRQTAKILDQADKLRRSRAKTLAVLAELKRSIFFEMFVDGASADWPVSKVENLVSAIRTGPFGSQLLHSEFVDSGIAVVGIDNAVSNTFKWGERRFITPEKYSTLARYRVYAQDLIITIMGTCGRAAVVPHDIPIAITTKHLCCLTLEQEVCMPDYLHSCFLLHPHVQHQLGIGQRGAIMAGLNMQIIRSLEVPLPPIDRQRVFAERMAVLAQQENHHRAHLGKLEDLFASIQQSAFSGKISTLPTNQQNELRLVS